MITKRLDEIIEATPLDSNREDAVIIKVIIGILETRNISVGRASSILDDTKKILQKVVSV